MDYVKKMHKKSFLWWHKKERKAHLGGAGLDAQVSLRGWSKSGGRLIFGEDVDWKRLAPGDEKNKFDCDGDDGFKLPCSIIDGDIERASKLKHLKSLIGLGEREY